MVEGEHKMVMKKIMISDVPVIIGNSSKNEQLFPPGFRYRMGNLIYTVRRDCTQESTSPMREVSLSDGATEIIPVESIIKDIKEISQNKAYGEILDPDIRFAPSNQKIEKVIEKKEKGKTKKNNKKVNKRSRDNKK